MEENKDTVVNSEEITEEAEETVLENETACELQEDTEKVSEEAPLENENGGDPVESENSEVDTKVNSENTDCTETVTEENNDDTPESKKKKFWKEVLDWVEIAVAALLIALFVDNVIIANSTVPTSSMENTIMTNDRVIGTRLSYTVFGEPKRGDVAIFKFGWTCEHCKKARGEKDAPEVCPLCGEKMTHPDTMYYVKRIIGVPGDVIEFKVTDHVKAGDLQTLPAQLKGKEDKEYYTAAIYINGEKIQEDYLKDPMLYTGDLKFEVPEDCYFFLGDNRNDSNDSRFWDHPYIEKKDIIAKVQFRYYPGIKRIQ